MLHIIQNISFTSGPIIGAKTAFLFLLCLASGVTFGQDDDLGTEVVNIVKPYTPTISDAFKVKETPILNDSTGSQKKEVQYEIFSVPVASTFTPAKGKAATVEKAKPIQLYDNYATLGFGTYTSVLAELFSNFEISRTDNAGLFFKHNSSQGDIDGVLLDNKFYDTELIGNYSSRQRDMSYKIEAGLKHQLFNWYGLNPLFEAASDELLNGIDPQQTYLGVNLGGDLTIEESLFTGGSARIHYLSDTFSSSEFNAILQPKFSFPLTEFTLTVDGDVNYLAGSFDRDYFNTTEISYSYLNAGVTPSLVYVNDDLTLSLGAEAVVSLDSENSQTNFFIYPKINLSYRLVDELLIVYGGANGSLDQNSYRNFKDKNPFVSPTLNIAPTSTLYEAFGGLKGKISNEVGYNVRGSYGKQENKALFLINPYKGMSADFEGYEYGNSFGVIYDDLNVLHLFGELKVEISDGFSLGVNANFYSYSLDTQPEAWNLPDLTATLFSNFDITEEIFGSVSLFLVGERKDLFTSGTSSDVITLNTYFDANVSLGYRVSDRLSLFLKGSNLLGKNYEKWNNYPVQGIQGLIGATYKFDW
jgi:hypothetical protein